MGQLLAASRIYSANFCLKGHRAREANSGLMSTLCQQSGIYFQVGTQTWISTTHKQQRSDYWLQTSTNRLMNRCNSCADPLHSLQIKN